MELNHLIIFIVGLVGSVFGTVIGGASLITIPSLLFLGLPPHMAIGTDRFGIVGIGIMGWYKFHKKGLINYRIGLSITIPGVLGAFIGANLVFEVDESILKIVIIVVNVLALFFILLTPSLGIEKKQPKVRPHKYTIGSLITFFVGIYGGFYGVMAGTFSFYILIFWFGLTFLESAGSIKIATVCTTFTAACVFAYNGAIAYPFAIPLFLGCCVGSYIGAHYADKIGNVWIKRAFIFLLFLLIIRLMFQFFQN